MQIAVIGAGGEGQALAGSFVRAGHQVMIANRTQEKAQAVAASVGGQAAASYEEAIRPAEVVVLAVNFAAGAESVSKAIAAAVAGKVVVDVSNPLKPDYSGLVTEGGPSAGELVQSWLPGASVVKAFNTNFAGNLGNPVVDGEALDAFVASDDDRARATVLGLAADIGFRPIDVGGLARSRELEAMMLMQISMEATKGGEWRSAFKLLGAPAGAIAGQARTAGTASR